MLVEQQYGSDPRTGEILWARPRESSRRPGLGFVSAGAGASAAAAGGGIAASIATAGILAAPIALQMWLNRKGPGQKRTTSMIAEEAQRLMEENLELYLAGHIDQATAMGNFDVAWQWLFENCSQLSMGEPGQRCVNERKRGGQWDYFARFFDPIRDTPPAAAVGPDGRAIASGSLASYLPSGGAGGGLSTTTLVVAGVAIAAALAL
jgi:hypothetical protein